jgi:hypothetical protein
MKRTLDIAAIVLTALLLLGFALLSVRGTINPQWLGPVRRGGHRRRRRAVLSGYLSRNLVIVVTGAVCS